MFLTNSSGIFDVYYSWWAELVFSFFAVDHKTYNAPADFHKIAINWQEIQ